MSNNQTEVVDESRPPIPKDPGALVIRYYKDGTWHTADFCSESFTRIMYDNRYKEKYPAARLIRILPEGEGKP